MDLLEEMSPEEALEKINIIDQNYVSMMSNVSSLNDFSSKYDVVQEGMARETTNGNALRALKISLVSTMKSCRYDDVRVQCVICLLSNFKEDGLVIADIISFMRSSEYRVAEATGEALGLGRDLGCAYRELARIFKEKIGP